VRQDSHERFGPRLRQAADLRVAKIDRVQKGRQGVGAEIRDLVLQRLVGRQRQELAFLAESGNLDVGVDHRFGKERRPFSSFGGGAEFLAHVRHRLFFHRLSGTAWCTDGDGRGRANGAALGNRDRGGREADERPRRNGALVHECYRTDRRAK